MKLLIHDYDKKEWEKAAEKYAGWEVISDRGGIRPCAGCFGCWTKTPGTCVIKDGYEHMGSLIHQADELLVISRYTYGGFSSFVKNVFDRSIAWVLPFFEIAGGEMHHKKRYPEDKEISFIFRGGELTDDDQAKARQYVEAVCRNFHAVLKSLVFEEGGDGTAQESAQNAAQESARNAAQESAQTAAQESARNAAQESALNAAQESAQNKAQDAQDEELAGTVLVNCSMRGNQANTRKLLERIAADIEGDKAIVNLGEYGGRLDELIGVLLSAGKIVLGMPMYVDGIPSAALKVMEALEKYENTGGKKIYSVTNMGFYESAQQKHLLGMIHAWCEACGFDYCGAAAVGAGEMLGGMTAFPNAEKSPAREAALGLKKLAEAVNASSAIEDIYIEPYKFPRFLYMLAANANWLRPARQNGLKKKDLYARP